jgi:dimethylsulfoniopropionate demethylase
MSTTKLNVSRRIRATPYKSCVESHGVSGYSVVNHTVLPKGFRKTVEEDYWHLKKYVQIWDVGCQRQVAISGHDAAKLTQLMTPRDLTNATVGQCLYAPMVDEAGRMLNDPIILKLAEDCFWLSIADSDVLLWAKGLAVGMQLDVQIHEPDVWPLSIQGPLSDDLMEKVFGRVVRDIRFFRFKTLRFEDFDIIVARSGYSKQGGFELYLDKPERGAALWDALWTAGQEFNISPGSPNLIERVEGGLLSYGNEMNMENNPLECAMDQYCQLDGSIDFIGREALRLIQRTGPQQLIRGVIFNGEKCPPCQSPWPILRDGVMVGQVTTAIWSPRFENNIALGMLERNHWQAGTEVTVQVEDGSIRNGMVTDLPMIDHCTG